jgi:steroid 5-alpha reductase family enzyme
MKFLQQIIWDNIDIVDVPKRVVPPLQCYLAYASALAIGCAAWVLIMRFNIIKEPVWTGLAVTVICTLVILVYSLINNNSSIYDPYWVIAPPLLALALKATTSGLMSNWHPRQAIIVCGLVFWALRYHVFYRWSGWRNGLIHEDWRYELMRKAPVPYWLNSLSGMHLFPTVLVYFAFLPAAMVLVRDATDMPGLNLLDISGVMGVLAAVIIQMVSDMQMKRYRASSEYKNGGAFRGGLWNFSRHPNYFGEVLFWISLMLFSFAAGAFVNHLVLVLTGPVMMALFFRFSSWLMDIRSLKKRKEYRHTISQVSALVPWFPGKDRRETRNSMS